MPELPEVETTRRGIAPHVIGRRVERIVVYDSRLRWPVPADLDARMRGRTIDRVDRRSKYLLFHAGDSALLVHLGMTGTLRLFRNPHPRRTHDHVDIVLDDGTLLRYHDPRRFGAMLWLPATRDGHPLLDSLGPEPFDTSFDAEYFWRATRSRRAPIKAALMDNHVVTGVGNIYANEALFAAGIDPSRPARSVPRERLRGLHGHVRRILAAAIASEGTTFRDYVTGTGARGNFQLEIVAYSREGQPCVVCGTRLVMTHAIDARSTVFCWRCQT